MKPTKNPEIELISGPVRKTNQQIGSKIVIKEDCPPDYCGPDQCGPDYEDCKPNDKIVISRGIK